MMRVTLDLLKHWHQFQSCARDFGMDEALCRSLVRLKVFSVCQSLDFYLLGPESLSFNKAGVVPPYLKIREVASNEIQKLKMAKGLPPPEEFRRQFERGSRLFALVESDTFLGIDWVNLKFADLTHIHRPFVALSEKTAYFYGAIVSPDYRSRGMGTALKQFILRKLREEGVQTVFTATYLKETGPRRWQKANRFEKWGRVHYFKMGHKDWWWTRLTPVGRKFPHLLDGSS